MISFKCDFEYESYEDVALCVEIMEIIHRKTVGRKVKDGSHTTICEMKRGVQE